MSQGTLKAEQLLEKRRNSLAGPKPADSGFDDPAVKVEQRTSEHHTIVDIHTKDEVGLLSRLCRAISGYGCEISYSCINTMGDVAVDVFYVDRAGKKMAVVRQARRERRPVVKHELGRVFSEFQ